MCRGTVAVGTRNERNASIASVVASAGGRGAHRSTPNPPVILRRGTARGAAIDQKKPKVRIGAAVRAEAGNALV